jgi:membrane protein YdbS with pleckstrin-like domain
MLDRFRTLLLGWLRVPPQPHPPAGAPGSTRIFRAGRRFYHLRLAVWAIAQIATLSGILFSLWFFHRAEQLAQEIRSAATRVAPTAITPPAEPPPKNSSAKSKIRSGPKVSYDLALKNTAERMPWWMFRVIMVLEIVALGGFSFVLVVTFAAVRLDYEQRWYIVTDRSLRLRSGIWNVQELTMSFANLQQVTVTQGPLQRLLGLANVHVQTAGGGGGKPNEENHESLHTAEFHCVDNAPEIRDLILDRLRVFRATGLGDPDDQAPAPPAAPTGSAALAAARELLLEATALRRTLTG